MRYRWWMERTSLGKAARFLVGATLLFLTASCVADSVDVADAVDTGEDTEWMASPADSLAIESLLDTQVAAWNRGDIPAFMGGYWKSPELRFASGGRVNRGWQVTLDGYLQRYPDAATMGTLRFEDREVSVLDPRHALVFGRWILDREGDQPEGLFTLLLERFEQDAGDGAYQEAQGWRVVADHTSSK